MKNYIKPIAEILNFDDDVITTSNITRDSDETEPIDIAFKLFD